MCPHAFCSQRRQHAPVGRYVEVDAVLTSAAMNMAVGEIFAADVSFDVVGAPRDITV